MVRNAATAHPVNGQFAYEPDSDQNTDFDLDQALGENFNFSSQKPFEIRSAWKVRALTIGIWVMLFLAATGGIYAFFRAQPGKTPKIPPSPDASSPAGFAEMYVTQYLEATNDSGASLQQFYPGATVDNSSSAPQFFVRHAAVVRIEPQQQTGYFAVTVSAQLLENTSSDVNTPNWVTIPELRYYRVGVYQGVDDNGYATWVATSMPSEVPEVKVATTEPDQFVGNQGASDNQVTALTQFFNAYLVGTGKLQFVSTDNARSHLRAFKVPPFQNGSVEVTDAFAQYTNTPAGKKQNEAIAVATVTATDANQTQQVFSYTLRMEYNGKVWLIDDVLSAPPLAPASK